MRYVSLSLIIDTLDIRPKAVKTLFYVLIATVYLSDVLYAASAFRVHGSYKQSYARPNVGA